MPSDSFHPDANPDFISRQVSESDYYFLDLKPSPQADFTVTCGGVESCDVVYSIKRRNFAYYGIEYIVSGSCSLMLGGREHQLRAGSIFCYSPKMPHEIKNTGEAPLIKYFIDFAGKNARRDVAEPFLKPPVPFQIPDLRVMNGIFQQIQQTGKQGGTGCQRILRQLLGLVSLMVRFKAVELDDAVTGSYETYARCLSEIEQHFSTLKSVDELASRCHVSSGHLARIFKKFADESPWQMITRLKMNRSGELLLRDGLMIKEAAHSVGFEDAYHFSRVFKQHFGMSPKQFRESIRSS